MKVDTITELKVVSYTKLKNCDKRNLLNRAKRKTECVVKEVPEISELLEDYGYKKGTKVYVEVKE
jgi:hypothetical protein